MNAVLIFFLAALTYAITFILIKAPDRKWMTNVILAIWIILLPLLILINDWMPFTEGGDDSDYYYLAATPINSFAQVFDLTRFIGQMEQPGYPWLLSIFYQFTNHNLLAFKMLNLTFFILLIPIWYLIGVEIESRIFGRIMSMAIIILTPLWFYWMFLLKDMTIVLLQSIFLLGMVQAIGRRGTHGWLLVVGATLALIPFRSQLLLVNLAVLTGTAALTVLYHRQGRNILTIIISVIVMGGVLTIATNPERMAALGIYTEHRVIGTQAATQMAILQGTNSLMNRALFPILYVIIETTGLNPETWTNVNANTLRGVLALPWIFVGVPLFGCGILWLVRPTHQTVHQNGITTRTQKIRLLTTPWNVVILFILAYMAMSWTVGDTTRWRIPDMPAIASVAAAGWINLRPRLRIGILIFWIISTTCLVAFFYLLRGL